MYESRAACDTERPALSDTPESLPPSPYERLTLPAELVTDESLPPS